MDIMSAFMGQNVVAMIGEIVLFANTVTMAMPTRWKGNMIMEGISKILNVLAGNVFKNKNADDKD
tara:strand:- start:32 stop:226 length:195 start_codon:yes stop_codon:yes gene_type:complete